MRDFHDQRLINVLRARRRWDQCAADCTTGSPRYCLRGAERRPLGTTVFPVCWLHSRHHFTVMAEGWKDKPDEKKKRRKKKSSVSVLRNISFHSHAVRGRLDVTGKHTSIRVCFNQPLHPFDFVKFMQYLHLIFWHNAAVDWQLKIISQPRHKCQTFCLAKYW